MRRPALTPKQRQHAREHRALLTLRRAAVRYARWFDEAWEPGQEDMLSLARTDLDASALKYAGTISTRERKRLSK